MRTRRIAIALPWRMLVVAGCGSSSSGSGGSASADGYVFSLTPFPQQARAAQVVVAGL